MNKWSNATVDIEDNNKVITLIMFTLNNKLKMVCIKTTSSISIQITRLVYRTNTKGRTAPGITQVHMNLDNTAVDEIVYSSKYHATE